MAITIMKAGLKDAVGLVGVVGVMGYKVNESEMKERLEKIMDREDHCLLVAKAENKVVGFCHGYMRALIEVNAAVEIGGLAVAEGWQGKGIAKELVKAVETWARECGYIHIVLSSNILRDKAHGFYEHMGYKKVKQQYAFEKWLK